MMIDGLGVEGLRNLRFWTATCQMGRKEALRGENKLRDEGDIVGVGLYATYKIFRTGTEDTAAHETENERVRTRKKIEELNRDFLMSWILKISQYIHESDRLGDFALVAIAVPYQTVSSKNATEPD
ncbi:hypothetical protein LXL04_025683 [Taraxacum kok-saghyz]